MFICNCNGLTERQVKAAVDAGARRWTDVHAHHGCSPQCGGCGADIAAMIEPAGAQGAPPLTGPVLAKA